MFDFCSRCNAVFAKDNLGGGDISTSETWCKACYKDVEKKKLIRE